MRFAVSPATLASRFRYAPKLNLNAKATSAVPFEETVAGLFFLSWYKELAWVWVEVSTATSTPTSIHLNSIVKSACGLHRCLSELRASLAGALAFAHLGFNILSFEVDGGDGSARHRFWPGVGNRPLGNLSWLSMRNVTWSWGCLSPQSVKAERKPQRPILGGCQQVRNPVSSATLGHFVSMLCVDSVVPSGASLYGELFLKVALRARMVPECSPSQGLPLSSSWGVASFQANPFYDCKVDS